VSRSAPCAADNRLVRYYLGAPCPPWLSGYGIPTAALAGGLALFVSHPRLAGRRSLPTAGLQWACDSGAYSELRRHGRSRITPAQYVRDVARFDERIGRMRWAAGMDWLCSPDVIWSRDTSWFADLRVCLRTDSLMQPGSVPVTLMSIIGLLSKR
jgi:hypothetical protein